MILLLAAGMVASACGKGSGSTSGSPSASASVSASAGEGGSGQITIGSDKANNHGSQVVTGSTVDVEMDNYYFGPTVLTGTAGQKVTITFDNHGSALHNFTLTDQNISQDVSPGSSGTVTVTFPASGSLEFFCKYHKALGMVGELTVG
jgi:plastocyanin